MVATASAADFKARYPEFDGVADALVNAIIAEAAPMVDDEWEEGDQKPGIMALAAHLLSLEGYPNRVANPASFNAATAGKDIIARRVGDVSTQYAQTAASSGSDFLSSLGNTVYGRRFSQLLKLNCPAIGLV